MTDEQQQQFTTWLDTDVHSTAKTINWVEQQFGLNYSESGMGKLLGRLDYRYKQPADGERVAQLLQKIRAANSGKRLLRRRP